MAPAASALDVAENARLSMRVAVLGDDARAVRRLILFNGGEGAVEAGAGAMSLDASQQCVARPVWRGDRHRPVACECWDLPAATLEAQPTLFWSVAAPAISARRPRQAAIVVASDIDSAVRWGNGYRQACRFDDRPVVLAWCDKERPTPNKRQMMVSFAAVERFDPESGEGARRILEAAATAFMEAEKRRQGCVLS